MCLEGEKWAMNSDRGETVKGENLPQTRICL